MPTSNTPAKTAPLPVHQSGAVRGSRVALAAVVLMVRVAFAVLLAPPGVTELELSEQVMSAEAGALQLRPTAPLNPFLPSIVMVEVAVPPGAAMVATVP
jgi:hypothetical protein